MSLYFEKKLEWSASSGNRIYLDLIWHSIQPLLAISIFDDKKGGLVSIYDHLKEETSDVDMTPRPDIQVSCIGWNPIQTFLAIGYESGEVIVWNHQESESFEGPKNHRDPITIIQWSPCGSILLSCDSIGNLVVWTSNAQGHLQVKTNHDFKDPVVQIVFRTNKGNNGKEDTTEKTLEKMTSWRPKTAAMRDGLNLFSKTNELNNATSKSTEDLSFFVGLLSGAIFYVKLNGTSEEVLMSGSSVKCLLFYEPRDLLVVMTEAAVLGQFHVDINGGLNEMNKVKLNGQGEIKISWVKAGIMAVVSEDLSLRLWDMNTGANNVIQAKGSDYSADEIFAGVDYNTKTGILCCSTNKGKLIMWKEAAELTDSYQSKSKSKRGSTSTSKSNSLAKKEDDELWELYSTASVSLTTKSVQWCQNISGVLALNAVRDVFILREHHLSCCYNNKVGVIQVSPNQLSVSMFKDDLNFDIKSTIQIKSFTTNGTHLCLWSGNEVEIYEIGITAQSNQRLIGSFSNKSDTIYMYEQSLFILETEQILVKSFQGIVKQTLTFISEEGQPITISLGGEYLTAATGKGFLKLWHVGQREAKIHATPENLHASIIDLGEIIQAKNNIEGTKVALTVAKRTSLLNSHLYVWDTTYGIVSAIEFPGLFVSTIFWDTEDETYIAIELKVIPPDNQEYDTDIQTRNSFFQNEEEAKEAVNKIIERKKSKLPNSSQIDRFAESKGYDKRKDKIIEDLKSQKQLIYNQNEIKLFEAETLTEIETGSTLSRPEKEKRSKGNSTLLEPQKSESDRKALESIRKKFELKEKEFWEQDNKNNFKSIDSEEGLDIRDEDEFSSLIESNGVDTNTMLFPVIQRKQIKDYGILKEDMEEQILTMFVSTKHGFVRHEKNLKDLSQNEILLGLDVPNLYIYQRVKGDGKFKGKNKQSMIDMSTTIKMMVGKLLIKDFDGIQDEKIETKKALLTYTFHNLIGDADGAVKAMRSVESKDIWTNMARNCVKTKRVDIAYSCFAHLNDARAVRAIKMAEKEPELDARVAMLAIQLNMVKEAEELYRNCSRFDLLLRLYKASRRWKDAIALCEKDYRINLRTTYHAYGKFLEKTKKIDEAIEMFEKSETHRYEVPRMLVDKPEKLEKYVNTKKDKELYQWWAQYLESGGEVESSLQYYEFAEDWLSLVRLLCFCGEIDKAVIVAERVNDKASSYHLARTLEEKGETQKSIRFYTNAGAIGNGIRLCKENQLDETLWNLALLGNSAEMADAAKYFEKKEKPEYEKAVQLYHKAGYGSKALDLAFTTQQYSALQMVAKELLSKEDHQTDPELLQKCAQFFISNEQFDRALDMLTAARKHAEAMDMCVQYNLPIDEELAERLTAPKGIGVDDKTRIQLLQKMGECCTHQGNYHLAAKKFTQAGNKMQAMKALLKSGDTERIIFYANVSRNREIYMMAANYLQTTDWRDSTDTVENIVNFYTRAKAPESVAAFYESFAQTIVDEIRDYEKCLVCLKKAEGVFTDLLRNDSTGSNIKYNENLRNTQLKMQFVTNFLRIKQLFFTNPMEAQEQSAKLLTDPNLKLVNKGDIYEVMVDYLVSSGNARQAVYLLDEMKASLSLNSISRYISIETLQAIEQTVGEDYFRINFGQGKPTSKTRYSGSGRRNSSPQYEIDAQHHHHESNSYNNDEEVVGDDDDDDEEEENDELLNEELEEEVEELDDEESDNLNQNVLSQSPSMLSSSSRTIGDKTNYQVIR